MRITIMLDGGHDEDLKSNFVLARGAEDYTILERTIQTFFCCLSETEHTSHESTESTISESCAAERNARFSSARTCAGDMPLLALPKAEYS